ncbi:MAG: transglutaminase-like domain-containing protein [Candidatus Asgardarchaeum sp.]
MIISKKVLIYILIFIITIAFVKPATYHTKFISKEPKQSSFVMLSNAKATSDITSDFLKIQPTEFIKPNENGTGFVTLITSSNKLGVKYFIGSAFRYYFKKTIAKNYKYYVYEEPIQLPNKMTLSDFEEYLTTDSNVMSSGYIDVYVYAPAYWSRFQTITVKIKVVNNMPFPYTFIGYARAFVKDKYLDGDTNYNDWEWVTESSGSAHISFKLNPGRYKWIYVQVSIGCTSVGLKKIVAGLDLIDFQLYVDKGYNFVQRFNKAYDYPPPTLVNQNEDVFEQNDLIHPTYWSVIKKAGEATDSPYIHQNCIDTPFESGEKVLHWVNSHFTPDSESILFTYNSKKYTFFNVTAADIWTLAHIFSDGKYHGICDEYTTLYVAFMRSLNVPTRYIVVDFFMIGGHAFAEIWAKDPNKTYFSWIHADPAFNEFNNPSAEYGCRYPTVWQSVYDSHSDWDVFTDDNILDNAIYYPNVTLQMCIPKHVKFDREGNIIEYEDTDTIQYFKYTGPNQYG